MVDSKEKINSYFKGHKDVVAVYLFGSRSLGTQRPFSDVDIGIVLQHSSLDQARRLKNACMVELGRILRKDIHVVILNTAGELLLAQVFKKGVCVCVNDKDEFKRFKMVRYAMISDFGYYLKQTQSGFRKHLLGDCQIG